MILFACAILFYIAERLDFLYLCDFMGLILGMPFSDALSATFPASIANQSADAAWLDNYVLQEYGVSQFFVQVDGVTTPLTDSYIVGVSTPALSVSLLLALAYLSAELISENSWLRRVPRLPRIVTSAIAINEAISAYSMAVAPDSSDAKSLTNFMCEAPNSRDGFSVAVFVIARRF